MNLKWILICREIRAKRKRKKLLQDQQLKDEKKEDEKIDSPEKPKSEDDEDTKDTTTGMDDERAESPTESRVRYYPIGQKVGEVFILLFVELIFIVSFIYTIH